MCKINDYNMTHTNLLITHSRVLSAGPHNYNTYTCMATYVYIYNTLKHNIELDF